jgi:hypothetical protein
MKKLTSLSLCALASAITLGIGTTFAQEQGTTPERTQDQYPTTEHAPQQQRSTAEVVAASAHITSQPANTILAAELIGSNVKSGTDQDLGSISDFIVDDDGQIVAVIVGVGGFLGVGEKDIAIAWDSVMRTMNEDGDGYDLQANMTELALRDTPAYE